MITKIDDLKYKIDACYCDVCIYHDQLKVSSHCKQCVASRKYIHFFKVHPMYLQQIQDIIDAKECQACMDFDPHNACGLCSYTDHFVLNPKYVIKLEDSSTAKPCDRCGYEPTESTKNTKKPRTRSADYAAAGCRYADYAAGYATIVENFYKKIFNIST